MRKCLPHIRWKNYVFYNKHLTPAHKRDHEFVRDLYYVNKITLYDIMEYNISCVRVKFKKHLYRPEKKYKTLEMYRGLSHILIPLSLWSCQNKYLN